MRPFDVSLVVPWMIVSLVAVLQKNAGRFFVAPLLTSERSDNQKGKGFGDGLEDLVEVSLPPFITSWHLLFRKILY